MTRQPKPPCPRCGTSKQVMPLGVSGDMFVCNRCGGAFDGVDPDEGSDYDDRNPAARLERQERQGRRGR